MKNTAQNLSLRRQFGGVIASVCFLASMTNAFGIDRTSFFETEADYTSVEQLQLDESASEPNLDTIEIRRDGKLSSTRGIGFSPTDNSTAFSESFSGLAPEIETDLLDSVHGKDERVQVTNTTVFPVRAIGRLELGCTGTLVGPRVVLTAGHCVFNVKTGKWYDKLDFSPGQSTDKTKPYGTFKWKTVVTTKAWTEQKKKDWDFAVVILEQPAGNTVGWMGYGYDDGLKALNININGYPSDKPVGTMWHSFCGVDKIESERFQYKCDTYKGNSGSAIYRYVSSNGERKIFGVHTDGFASYNEGVRLTKAKFEKIKGWKAANP